MSDLTGLGAKEPEKSSGLADGALQRSKLPSNDRLLEQIMGRKAAQAHKKSKEMTVGKGMGTARHGVTQSEMGRRDRTKEVEIEDDEGEGRAASFRSKKVAKPVRIDDPVVKEANVASEVVEGAEEDGVDAVAALAQRQAGDSKAKDPDSEEQGKSAKRKGGSYLDELLAEKSRKKSKKNKKKAHSEGG